MHRTVPTTKSDLAQNVASVEVEKLLNRNENALLNILEVVL